MTASCTHSKATYNVGNVPIIDGRVGKTIVGNGGLRAWRALAILRQCGSSVLKEIRTIFLCFPVVPLNNENHSVL